MKEEIKKEIESIVEEFLNRKVFENDIFKELLSEDGDKEWFNESNEELIIKNIIEVLENRISSY